MNSMSSRALASAVRDISTLVNLTDKLGGSAPGIQSRAVVGEDLSQVTKSRTQARALTLPEGNVNTLVNFPDKLGGPAPGTQLRVEDLSQVTKTKVQARALGSPDGSGSAIVNLSGGSALGTQSRTVVGEDLSHVTKSKAQARALASQDGSVINRKVKRRIDSMALSVMSSVGSVANSLQRPNDLDLETESTATSKIKRPKIEVSDFQVPKIFEFGAIQ